MRVAAQRSCNIVSMSFGLSNTIAGNYPQADGTAQLKALIAADIIAVAAASNEGSSSGGSSLFTTGVSPGSVPGVLSVASVENTAQPGSLLQLDRVIDTPTGPTDILGEQWTIILPYVHTGSSVALSGRLCTVSTCMRQADTSNVSCSCTFT
jgi:subtilisin family serine protease